jgi:hypothetical protein
VQPDSQWRWYGRPEKRGLGFAGTIERVERGSWRGRGTDQREKSGDYAWEAVDLSVRKNRRLFSTNRES